MPSSEHVVNLTSVGQKLYRKKEKKIATNQDKVVKKDQEHSNSMLKEHGLVGKKYGKKNFITFNEEFLD